MTDAPPPYDGQPFAPIGELNDTEKAWAGHLAARGYIELRWRLVGRDAAGHLVATTVLPCGRDTTTQRNCYLTLTPAGLVSRSARVPAANADQPTT